MSEAALHRVAGLDIWSGPVDPQPLPGGISNLNFLVEDAGQRFVVRVADDAPEHAVYRFNEITVSQAAHAAGLAPGVVHHEPGILVLDYVEGGRPLSAQDVCSPAWLERLVGLVGRCHIDLPGYLEVPGPMFWPFHINRRYARIIVEGGGRLRERLPELMNLNDSCEEIVGAIRPVFCHNDLLAANILDDGKRLWLVDWEYGAWNSALFDLANLSTNAGMPDGLEAELLARYAGVSGDSFQADAFAAMRCVSLLREALWSIVSELHSPVDFDYEAYSDDYLRRLDDAAERLAELG